MSATLTEIWALTQILPGLSTPKEDEMLKLSVNTLVDNLLWDDSVSFSVHNLTQIHLVRDNLRSNVLSLSYKNTQHIQRYSAQPDLLAYPKAMHTQIESC